LAVAVGIREAARQTGISPNTILSWSKREGWFKPPDLPLSVIKQNGDAISAIIPPATALSNALADDSRETKLDLSTGFRNAARAYKSLPPEKALAMVSKGKETAQGAALVHAWEAESSG